MAIAKIIYKESAEDAGTVWMDTTQKTVTAGSMLDGVTALKNDGTDITGSIATKTSANLSASGATVTAPAGYYASDASKSVASGTEGAPTASKGTVSNHSVSVTPSVTNSAGYISGGTKTGTAVTVSASELVSGTKTISTSGTTDVTNYASASVAAGSAATPATTITANPSISVNSSTGLITATASATQSVTPTVSEGYVSAGTAGTITVSGSNTSQLSTQSAATITPTTSAQIAVAAGKYTLGAVTVDAIPSQYIVPSGTINITENGTVDVTSYASASVSVSSGGGGLTYETGTWTPASDISRGEISFNEQHSTMPIMVAIADNETGTSLTQGSNTFMAFVYEYGAFGFGVPYNTNGTSFRYGFINCGYFSTNNASYYESYTCGNNGTGSMSTNNVKYWADESNFYPYTNSASRYWRAGKTYKWIAVWGA